MSSCAGVTTPLHTVHLKAVLFVVTFDYTGPAGRSKGLFIFIQLTGGVLLFLSRLKDCGEDLLVDVSEVLFNEIAFFRLIKDTKGLVLLINDEVSLYSDFTKLFRSL